MNGLPVEKQTFVDADEKTYRSLEYDLLNHIWTKTSECLGDQDTRICKLEKRKRIDTGISAGTGVIGGILAFIGKWFFFKGTP